MKNTKTNTLSKISKIREKCTFIKSNHLKSIKKSLQTFTNMYRFVKDETYKKLIKKEMNKLEKELNKK